MNNITICNNVFASFYDNEVIKDVNILKQYI
jgi:hypothetical protein